ncbi:MAG: pyridoxal phosphate-dependent aminotransferase [Rubrivivax sp.]|nr:pyridoxal phosphate-dependent aminotransferase [Rubrivivax sp.]MDP3615811.1 pyridoxal phosphate-dependent aminotransferase [Rubrivivax sp.]
MRTAIQNLPGSKIREVANAGLGRSDVLAFWFGESDEVTPEPIRQAAADSLLRGETFYSHNLGLPELRQAIAAYASGLHGPLDVERVAVTSSGVTALMLAMQMLLDAGDELVAVVPVWPNLTAQPQILGAKVKRVSLRPKEGLWQLDLDELLAAVTDKTRVLLLNAPNNPTGWTLSREEQQSLLLHCRRTGTWIVADEVYERIHFGGARCAPSFLDVATPDDRLLIAHSFSKSFLMTGWRLGWLVLPASSPAHGYLDAAGKLLEFNSSCAPVFVQRGAQAALAMADTLVPRIVADLKARRDQLIAGLQALPRVTVATPPGGLYAFFRVEGLPDSNNSLALAKRLVADHGLGLAPGAAFGDEGEGWLRWCFASQDPARLDLGLNRLAGAIRL